MSRSFSLLSCFLVVLVALLACSPALAEDAATLKAEGDRLMDGLRYQDALEKYDASYRVKPDPAVLYNQGRALEGLGRFPDALDKLLAFRDSAPKELLARLGNALDTNIEELRGRVATLTFTVDPEGASIRLGDRVLGVAPLVALRVNAGAAHFEVSREGFFTEVIDVPLEGGKDNTVTVTLSPRDNRATLSVASVDGASVTIDGVRRGQVPLEVRLSPGPHLVRVEQDGFETEEVTLDLAALEKKALDLTLSETPITYAWWFWTLIGVGVTGGGVAAALALTLEEPADSGSLSPGQLQVSPPGAAEAARVTPLAFRLSPHGVVVTGTLFSF